MAPGAGRAPAGSAPGVREVAGHRTTAAPSASAATSGVGWPAPGLVEGRPRANWRDPAACPRRTDTATLGASPRPVGDALEKVLSGGTLILGEDYVPVRVPLGRDEAELREVVDHLDPGVGSPLPVDGGGRVWVRPDIVGALGRPPAARAIHEVRLPGHGHERRHVARRELGRIQT